jgi:hypothetical protein
MVGANAADAANDGVDMTRDEINKRIDEWGNQQDDSNLTDLCARIAAAAVAAERERAQVAKGEPVFTLRMVEAIYAAWHGAGVDIAGGDWRRFVGRLKRAD